MSARRRCLTHLYVGASATALFSSAVRPAAAVRRHTLQHGETLAAVARQFHVSVQDIQSLNHLANVDNVPDGKKLLIPDPPHRLHVAQEMRVFTHLKGDQVSFRLGPDPSYRRVLCLDQGASVMVMALRDGWAQVRLDDERVGWVRAEFLAGGVGHHTAEIAAAHTAHSKPEHTAHHRAQVAVAHQGGHKHSPRNAEKSSKSHHSVTAASHTRRHDAEAAEGRHHTRQIAHAASHHHSNTSERRHSIHVASTHHRHSAHSIRVAAVHGGSDIVRSAYAYRGTPYVYGGSGRGGFDCSGFTSYLYAHRGVSLPHSARAQFHMGRSVGRGQMKPGDLVFFHTVTPGISHVGMYVGNGRFVHASSRRSGGVRVDNLDSGYYSQAFRGARRFLKH